MGGATIERLVSHSGWRLHPRIEEALLCHPGRSVIGDSLPNRFLHLGEDENYGISTVLDSVTGRVYDFDYFTTVQPTDGPEQNVYWLVLRAPSLSAWFAHWLDNVTGHERAHCWPFDPGDLMPEQVATADLLDPNQVWRGIYHFGLDWEQVKPVEASIVEDINQSVYRSNKDDFRSMQES